MSKHVFFCLLVLFLCGVHSQNSTKCLSQHFPVDFNAATCITNTWYLYAASDPCENCCLKRTMTTTKKGDVVVTDLSKKAGETHPTTTVYTGIREGNKTAFLVGNDTILMLAGTDCKNTAITYSTLQERLRVFSHDPNADPSFLSGLEGVKKCNMKIYEYNPAVACKGL